MKRMASLMLVLLLAAMITLSACRRIRAHKPHPTAGSSQPVGGPTSQPSDEY